MSVMVNHSNTNIIDDVSHNGACVCSSSNCVHLDLGLAMVS
jgi:hypothetical protein